MWKLVLLNTKWYATQIKSICEEELLTALQKISKMSCLTALLGESLEDNGGCGCACCTAIAVIDKIKTRNRG